MNTLVILLSFLLQASPAEPPVPPPVPTTAEILTLETVMSDPAWIGAAPERPRWSPDGRSVRFDRRRGTTRARDTFQLDPTTGETIRLEDAAADRIIGLGDWNPPRTSMITTRNGDLVHFDPATDDFTQITRTTSRESNPRFLVDGRIAFERDGRTIIRDLERGHEIEPASIRFEEAPEAPAAPTGLAADQRRLFDTLRARAEATETSRIRSEAIRETREHDVFGPIRLDPGLRETRRHLSPDARWMLLETAPAGRSTRINDDMPVFVTDDGVLDQGQAMDACLNDQARIDHIDGSLDALREAKEKGVNVAGYFYRAMFDDVDWVEGVSARRGLVYIDHKDDLRRYPKMSLEHYASYMRGEMVKPNLGAAIRRQSSSTADAFFVSLGDKRSGETLALRGFITAISAVFVTAVLLRSAPVVIHDDDAQRERQSLII